MTFEEWFKENIHHYHLFEWKIKDIAYNAWNAAIKKSNEVNKRKKNLCHNYECPALWWKCECTSTQYDNCDYKETNK